MELNQYQRCALETRQYPEEYKVIYPALGMSGEAGEVSDKVKKVLRDLVVVRDANGSIVVPEDVRESLAKEVGDVLWYVAIMAYDLGFDLEDIAKMNYEKLISRKNRDKISGSGDNR